MPDNSMAQDETRRCVMAVAGALGSVWAASGAWQHFPKRAAPTNAVICEFRVDRRSALELQRLMNSIVGWATAARFEPTPDYAAKCEAAEAAKRAKYDVRFRSLMRRITSRRALKDAARHPE